MHIGTKIRKLGALLMSAVTLIAAAGCQGSSGSEASQSESTVSPTEVTGDVTITTFDVGKADAMIIQTANTVTVIDAGNKGDGKMIEKYLAAQGIDTVNTLIITHFDKDHVGGAARVINRLKVETIYVPDYTSEGDEYQSFMEKVNELGKELTVMKAGTDTAWIADDAHFKLYAAKETFYGKDEENDFSLVVYMQHGANTFLFAGDAEVARQREIISMKLGQVTYLKFPYHGNYMSTTEDFLNAVNPKYAVVCCSEEENADPSTVETLKTRGVEAYYTTNGDITAVCDGSKITFTQGAAAVS